jgi:hypothetical protein
MAFPGNMERKSPTNKLRNAIIEAADPIKMKVHFQPEFATWRKNDLVKIEQISNE